MSLSERLAQQRATPGTALLDPAARHAARHADPFALVKRSVHSALIAELGPRLYDVEPDKRELELQITGTLQEVLQRDETPMTVADRARVARARSATVMGV